MRSAIRPVPHGPDLPILLPPDTLDNILDDLDQISHISNDSDDGYDPEGDLVFCNNVPAILEMFKIMYEPEEWRLFIDSSKRSLKAVLLHNGNQYASVNKVVTQSVLCEWDSGDRKQHNVKQTWPIRKALILGVKNVERQSLVDPKKILFPPLHIKLGLMKQFVKALDKEGECFKYLCEQFPGLSDAKLKEDIFVGPDTRKLLKDETFVTKMEMKEKKCLEFI
ncbi:uncharacterized protein TNCV_4077861 [Trichonephila clavipes]|nr:uncharacterized protein TNCV_4077861 [Trichonephila clavipes]